MGQKPARAKAASSRRIRDERLHLRLTLEQLAERVNKSTNYIGQIERNDGKPSLETVVDIANALGTTVDGLLRDSLTVPAEDWRLRELAALFSATDETGRQFLLEVARQYVRCHRANPVVTTEPPSATMVPPAGGRQNTGK